MYGPKKCQIKTNFSAGVRPKIFSAGVRPNMGEGGGLEGRRHEGGADQASLGIRALSGVVG